MQRADNLTETAAIDNILLGVAKARDQVKQKDLVGRIIDTSKLKMMSDRIRSLIDGTSGADEVQPSFLDHELSKKEDDRDKPAEGPSQGRWKGSMLRHLASTKSHKTALESQIKALNHLGYMLPYSKEDRNHQEKLYQRISQSPQVTKPSLPPQQLVLTPSPQLSSHQDTPVYLPRGMYSYRPGLTHNPASLASPNSRESSENEFKLQPPHVEIHHHAPL